MSHVNVFILGLFLVISQHVRASTCDSESVEDSPNINAPENSMVLEDSPRLPTNNPWLPYYYYTTPMAPQFATSVSTKVTPAFVPFTSCTSPNKETGICADSIACNRYGGRASGSCLGGRVCCINMVSNTCDESDPKIITIDNTYWLSPSMGIGSSSTSSCSVTVKLNAKLPEQGKAVCQVRLNFIMFSIGQPDPESVCSTDTFEVLGASNRIPTICGDNEGQHMYLNVPPSSTSPTDLQLTVTFGANSNSLRGWNVLISMIPCDSANLAPPDCLQYFIARTGMVKSFNWRDVAGTATRQLANQDYSICFRTTPGVTKTLCMTPCTVTATGSKAFSVSTAMTTPTADAVAAVERDVSQLSSLNCNNDFLIIPEGYNIGNPTAVLNMAFDRYCGHC
ncbi:hypothetical protein DAPPUDRAFT_316207 [Daphnia pulex]|uniref:CUB domain-containing protein n=1 Tax=Daphnia pulex TaxID=6669 RepID=E9GC59_DAPPU|nr:hypothetical protein DAPPUDRAFT_316207 [Daphnia pulex]|eukprot:EFX82921.1 hypothetical protein DAPPUDRAFT_316207 [Daphnia pulex]